MKKKKSGGTLSTVILILIFLVGLSLLLYPTVADYWNSLHQSQVIVDYNDHVDQLEQETYDRMMEQALQYNASLLNRSNPYLLNPVQAGLYGDMLLLSKGGAMAYLEIPSIGVTLPIHHGTSEAVLAKAVGHLEWSSLPVGGESSHCVISGHRGLPSAELLTNIVQLEVGDVFYIRVLGDTLEYVVDNIAVVEPDDLDLLLITEGKDYLTMFTCTPYGINSHRLLVRGVRVQHGEDAPIRQTLTSDGELISPLPIALGALVVTMIAVFLISALTGRKKPVSQSLPEKENFNEEENGTTE